MSQGPVRRPIKSRATILVLGLILTGVSIVSLSTVRSDNLAAELSVSGVDLVDRVHQAVETGLERTRGLSALFEASLEVHSEEFERYAHAIGPGRAITEMGYRHVDGVDRLGFSYRSSGPTDIDVLESVDLEPVIGRFAWTKQPASLGLLNDSGTLLVVGPVFEPGSRTVVEGIVYTVLDLGYLLERAPEGLQFTFRESTGVDVDGTVVAGPGVWRNIDLVAGRMWTFDVLRVDPVGLDMSLLLVAAFGVVGSVLAASRIGLRADKLATDYTLAALRQATADKDRFMASVSHELRTPLTSVVGLSAILESDWRNMDADEVQKMIGDVHHEGRELADLVEDLLTIGRVESDVLTFRPSKIDLDEEVGRVVERVQVPQHVRIDLATQLGVAEADALRTRQIVRNLMANAARHAATVISLAPVGSDGLVGVRVANDGPGIPGDQAERLFQAYQAGLRAGQPGSIGLGLYVSRQLARGMGGELRFVSDDHMVIFELTLPAASAEEPVQEAVLEEVGSSESPRAS